MGFSVRLLTILLIFTFGGAELQGLARDSKHLDLLQEFKQTRHKRNVVPTGTTWQPHISVHHYHYYYYCCPDMAVRVRADPQLAQAVHNASCGFEKSSCYCQFPSSQQPHQNQQHHQQPHQNQQHHQQHQQNQQHDQQPRKNQQQEHHQQQQQQQHQQHHQPQQQKQQLSTQTPKQPRQQDLFHTDRMFNDPIGKDFFDFVTNNFVRRDNERELDECLTSTFDDPICKDFFNLFTQNFIRKPEGQAAVPTNVPTHAPSHTTQPQQVKAQQADSKQPHKFKDLKDFHQVDSMFNELENNMKKAFSKTSDLGKILGIKLDDFR